MILKKLKVELGMSYILFVFSFFSYAQQQPFVPSSDVQHIPANPDVADIGRYGDVPINKYNGVANISIPFYMIDFDGLKIPIQITYATSGIPVEQEASWVGLGWQLSEGMLIRKTINGYEDIKSSLFTGDFHQGWIYSPDIEYIREHPDYIEKLSNADIDLVDDSYSAGVPIDTEPDVFEISLPSGNVKFYLPKVIGQETYIDAVGIDNPNFKIKYFIDTQSFEVIDPNGFIYVFDVKERSTGLRDYDSSPTNIDEVMALNGIPGSQAQGRMLITSWKVSSITSPLGRQLNFEHDLGFYMNHPHFIETYTSQLALNQPLVKTESISSVTRLNVSITAFHTQYLKKITGDFGTIDFVLEGRSDLFSVEAKKRYTNSEGSGWNPGIPPMEYSAKRLSEVLVKNKQGKEIVHSQLYHSYFNPDKLYAADRESYLRLKLDSVLVQNKKYKFEYHTPNSSNELPAKDSKSVDFWGYYNGVSNTVRIPSSNRFFLNEVSNITPNIREVFLKIDGASRKSDINFGKQGILTKVTYPTGGYTEFDYEGNEIALEVPKYNPVYDTNGVLGHSGIDNSKDYNFRYQYLKLANEDQYSFFQNNDCGVSGENIEDSFEITETSFCNGQDYNIKVSGYMFCGTGCGDSSYSPSGTAVKIVNLQTGAEYVIASYSSSINSHNSNVPFDVELMLPVGSYQLIKEIYQHQNPLVVAQVSAYGIIYHDSQSGEVAVEEFEVGGARLKRIKNFDSTGSFINGKRFLYDTTIDSTGSILSSGKLMDDLIFHAKADHFEYTPEPYSLSGSIAVNFYSDNMIRGNPSAMGSHIGYGQVTEIEIDRNENSNGKVVANYFNRINEPSKRNIGAVEVPFWGGLTIYYGNAYLLNTMQRSWAYLNGSVLSEEVYDKTGNIKRRTFNVYDTESVTPLPTRPIFYRSPVMPTENPLTTYPYHKMEGNYPNVHVKALLDSVSVTEYVSPSDSINTHKKINYNRQRPVEQITYTSDARPIRSVFYYPDQISDSQILDELVSLNRINVPVKSEFYKVAQSGGEMNLLKTEEKLFGKNANTGNNILPVEIISKKSFGQDYSRVVYNKYDQLGNPLYISRESGSKICYIWGWNNLLPIAKIENADYLEVAQALGLLEEDVEELDETDMNIIDGLRDNLTKANVTTYNYDPLIGITSITDSRGYTIYYQYDEFNRLESVRDDGNNLIQDYQYHYSTEQP